ncbi:MAG: hypothetical protein IPI81_17875 [Flavobacteriales bacterium]|nr:hypothetical protein [Flavobacteriales bacterium]
MTTRTSAHCLRGCSPVRGMVALPVAAPQMELLTMQPFDAVLCDHRLPDTDSMQLLGKIEAIGSASIAFIVITGYSDVRIAVELIRAVRSTT